MFLDIPTFRSNFATIKGAYLREIHYLQVKVCLIEGKEVEVGDCVVVVCSLHKADIIISEWRVWNSVFINGEFVICHRN